MKTEKWSIIKLQKQLEEKSEEEALALIGAEMKRPGADQEALSALIDEILGTGLPEEDPEVVGAVEARWRGRGR